MYRNPLTLQALLNSGPRKDQWYGSRAAALTVSARRVEKQSVLPGKNHLGTAVH